MTRFCLVLLVVGLVCIMVVAGCGEGAATATETSGRALNLPTETETQLHGPLPMVAVTPKSARDLLMATPTLDRREPPFVPRGPGHVGPHECGDFETWREANAFFIAAGGPERDPYQLDPDADGIPCEALREQELN